jgi:hypothetical protein
MGALATTGQIRRGAAGAPAQAQPTLRSFAYFEYAGGSGMTVIGAVTGRRYRFERPGARVAVDPADRASVAKVTRLKPVAGP